MKQTSDALKLQKRLEGFTKGGGHIIETLDKSIVSWDNGEYFGFNAWMEADEDVNIELFPPARMLEFENFQAFEIECRDTVRQIMDIQCGPDRYEVIANRFNYRPKDGEPGGHRIRLLHDRKRLGMDLLQIRFVALKLKAPDPAWGHVLDNFVRMVQRAEADRLKSPPELPRIMTLR